MSVKICWKNANGAIDEINLKPGSTIYIGRYPLLWSNSSYIKRVYILDENMGILKDSGLNCDTVSRLHLRISLDEQGKLLEIKDHGYRGKGSLNGFKINNVKYGSNSNVRIKLDDLKEPLKLEIGCIAFYITRKEGKPCYEILKEVIRQSAVGESCSIWLSEGLVNFLRKLRKELLVFVDLLERDIVYVDEFERVKSTLLSMLESQFVNNLQDTCIDIYAKINMFKFDLRLVKDRNLLARSARDLAIVLGDLIG